MKYFWPVSIVSGTLFAGVVSILAKHVTSGRPADSKQKTHEITPDPRYQCLLPGRCTEQAYLDLVQEYVGSVYGNIPSQFRYDGKPQPSELRDVSKQMGGKLTRSGDIGSYLAWAKLRLSFLKSGAECADGDFTYGVKATELGSFLFFSGPSRCGAMMVGFYQGVELAIASNPGLWLFFVEGAGVTENANNNFLMFVAERLGIPVVDPLLPPWDEARIVPALAKVGISKLDIAFAHAFLSVGSLLWAENEEVQEAVISTLKTYAKFYQFPENEFESRFYDQFTPPEGVDVGAFYRDHLEDSRQKIDAYTRIANRLSPVHIRKQLEKHQKKHAFYSVKNAYLSAVLKTYGVSD